MLRTVGIILIFRLCLNDYADAPGTNWGLSSTSLLRSNGLVFSCMRGIEIDIVKPNIIACLPKIFWGVSFGVSRRCFSGEDSSRRLWDIPRGSGDEVGDSLLYGILGSCRERVSFSSYAMNYQRR